MAKKNQNDDDVEGDDSLDFEEVSADDTATPSHLEKTFVPADTSDEFDLEDVGSSSNKEDSPDDSADATKDSEEQRDPSGKTVVVNAVSSTVDITSDEDAEDDDFDHLPSPEITVLYGDDNDLSQEDSFSDDMDVLDVLGLGSDSPEIVHLVETERDVHSTVVGTDNDRDSMDFQLRAGDGSELGHSEDYDDSFGVSGGVSFTHSGAGGVRGWGKQSPNATPMSSLESPTRTKRMMVAPKLNDRLVVDEGDREESGNPDYRIVSFLGEGAMGKVFIARQTSVDRDVAFKKQIKKEFKSRRKQIRNQSKFLFEAQVTANLDHPNIVGIYDMGRDQNGEIFYCMQLVRGDPWREVMDEMSLEENLEVLKKVINGMGYAHSKETIHRDLKPENIMLGNFGEVLIMDWGLGVNLSHGLPTSLGGTPGFMAPEMARPPEADTGTHSDIYLLGAILFKITTGESPHTGEDVRECLKNAENNIIVDPPADRKVDKRLLSIALQSDVYRSAGSLRQCGTDETGARKLPVPFVEC